MNKILLLAALTVGMFSSVNVNAMNRASIDQDKVKSIGVKLIEAKLQEVGVWLPNTDVAYLRKIQSEFFPSCEYHTAQRLKLTSKEGNRGFFIGGTLDNVIEMLSKVSMSSISAAYVEYKNKQIADAEQRGLDMVESKNKQIEDANNQVLEILANHKKDRALDELCSQVMNNVHQLVKVEVDDQTQALVVKPLSRIRNLSLLPFEQLSLTRKLLQVKQSKTLKDSIDALIADLQSRESEIRINDANSRKCIIKYLESLVN
jgi:hypothetical protein